MNEPNDDSFAIPAFFPRTALRRQSDVLEAFKNDMRDSDMNWILADYPVDRACSLKQCLGVLGARLFVRMGKN